MLISNNRCLILMFIANNVVCLSVHLIFNIQKRKEYKKMRKQFAEFSCFHTVIYEIKNKEDIQKHEDFTEYYLLISELKNYPLYFHHKMRVDT